MMAMNFRPHMDIGLPWKAAPALKRQTTPKEEAPEEEVEPHGDGAPLKKNAQISSDSDNETESATSTDKDTAAPMRPGVAQSFARAGKLLWSNNPLSGLSALTKHSRTVSDFSESDFMTPFAPGTPVWTRYGLGTIVTTRAEDGFLIVNLQNMSRMTLYLNPADEDYYSVPAIRYDWVETPAGEGRVVSFDAKSQSYRVRVGGDAGMNTRVNAEVTIHRADLRRVMPVRRQTQSKPVVPAEPVSQVAQEPSAITKGLNTALKTIVTTSSGLSTSTYQFVSNYYYQGQCVETIYGAGTIMVLDQNNHRAQVQLVWGATAFVNTEAILHYTKALVGMEVTTKFGTGIVTEVRAAEAMYGVKLHAVKDGEQEVVFVHESDVARGAGRRLRLGSAQKQISEKLGASTTKLLSFASNKVKLFGQGNAKNTSAASPVSSTPSRSSSDADAGGSTSAQALSRTKSVRVVESDDGVSSAGI